MTNPPHATRGIGVVREVVGALRERLREVQWKSRPALVTATTSLGHLEKVRREHEFVRVRVWVHLWPGRDGIGTGG